MTCIKTGANVYFEQYDVVVHGDLFKVGNCYLLQFQQDGFYNGSRCPAEEIHAVFNYVDDGYLHHHRGVCVVNEHHVGLVK